MASLKAPSALPKLVKTAFERALAEGELLYYPTQVAIIHAHNIPFQLRFSPALANKPKGPPKGPTPIKPFDPFADPPAALRVTHLSPSHYLVLNKFAVVPEHFILATTEFKPQTHVLDEADLTATLACIEAYELATENAGQENGDETSNDGLFAFFNCGDHSGASQPHRHIQMLPIARMKDGLPADVEWTILADSLTSRPAPFATFAEKIRLDMPRAELHAAYLRLYRQACRAVALHSGESHEEDEIPSEGETLISYNMAMTKNTLVICPRLAEGATIHKDGQVIGALSLNGTVLAGTALVKNEAEWEALKKDTNALSQVLTRIGLSSLV
ncbi:HIT-like domain-containing protein [Thelonectria olida]|uniref:HIT-like domain-containing protein n=1 Tax=Thelonectria olida TaxID=1576542 RepID=A0A9P8WEY7_9HYPO|nr:HIT-like domain-containing protein [Thelonectria olida]